MGDYREDYDRVVADKYRLLEQIQVLSDALKETQRQLRIERTAREVLQKHIGKDGGDEDDG